MSDRKRTIDDTDDVDDEDFARIEEDELDTDLTLHAADSRDVTGRSARSPGKTTRARLNPG